MPELPPSATSFASRCLKDFGNCGVSSLQDTVFRELQAAVGSGRTAASAQSCFAVFRFFSTSEMTTNPYVHGKEIVRVYGVTATKRNLSGRVRSCLICTGAVPDFLGFFFRHIAAGVARNALAAYVVFSRVSDDACKMPPPNRPLHHTGLPCLPNRVHRSTILHGTGNGHSSTKPGSLPPPFSVYSVSAVFVGSIFGARTHGLLATGWGFRGVKSGVRTGKMARKWKVQSFWWLSCRRYLLAWRRSVCATVRVTRKIFIRNAGLKFSVAEEARSHRGQVRRGIGPRAAWARAGS